MQVIFIVGYNIGFILHVCDQIYFQVFLEGIGWYDALGECRQNYISKLDAVVWQAVHKVEVEVAEELGEIMQYCQTHSQSSLVE